MEEDPLKDEPKYDRYATESWIKEEEAKGLKFERSAITVPYHGAMVYLFNAESHAKATQKRDAIHVRDSGK